MLSLSFRLSDKNCLHIRHIFNEFSNSRPSALVLSFKNIWWKVQIWTSLLCNILQYSLTPFLPLSFPPPLSGANVLLSSLFSNTLHLFSPRRSSFKPVQNNRHGERVRRCLIFPYKTLYTAKCRNVKLAVHFTCSRLQANEWTSDYRALVER